MNYYRPASARGEASFGWLNSKHSFSFGHYYDPRHMGVSALRVINDDTVAPGAGFDMHGHRDMEIISYILEGAIEHKDSMGNGFVVPAGEIQRMSAGTGVMHSEFNHSKTGPLKFLQIWIEPNVRGIQPSYEQKAIPQKGKLTSIANPQGSDGALKIHQDASIDRVVLEAGDSVVLKAERGTGYLHVFDGDGSLEDRALKAGDGFASGDELVLRAGVEGMSALWFDLPQAELHQA